eukprot:gnl/TRDRNA2_/TRDRNA2_200399_c0_seq1.p1 gnl/TRDRNA2_/TRDRNA2_200399_c0~~gnl/TRDRNA2_/TRDRNA2_200399_c0_seq1.p1  ORF type:complete len:391 (-),score=65.75 gnl/TRDRNA2_/TRDRNA2_200399_c0_seq1:37-1131(-)
MAGRGVPEIRLDSEDDAMSISTVHSGWVVVDGHESEDSQDEANNSASSDAGFVTLDEEESDVGESTATAQAEARALFNMNHSQAHFPYGGQDKVAPSPQSAAASDSSAPDATDEDLSPEALEATAHAAASQVEIQTPVTMQGSDLKVLAAVGRIRSRRALPPGQFAPPARAETTAAVPVAESADVASPAMPESPPTPTAEAAEPVPAASATLVSTLPLAFGSDSLAEWEGCRDSPAVAAAAAPALERFPGVTNACCLGRVVVFSTGRHQSSDLTVWARAIVRNNGDSAWPASSALRLVAGDGCGFYAMPIGAILPGQHAMLTLDLHLPPSGNVHSGSGTRSAWVLEDGYGAPFGPLLVLEVVWT